MNTIMKAVLSILKASHPRPAREARIHFLQHYSPQDAQSLLDMLHNAWHLNSDLANDEELLRIYNFYKRLSLLLAAEYALLKEGRRWIVAEGKQNESGS